MAQSPIRDVLSLINTLSQTYSVLVSVVVLFHCHLSSVLEHLLFSSFSYVFISLSVFMSVVRRHRRRPYTRSTDRS